jgi:ubiquinone/menaquinone biosynthesis C-methylase UbiE
VPGDSFYKDHWVNIDQERLDRYERMFQWNPASSALYEPADIRVGHIVADFGCGPGHTAIEIAKWVGPSGHVHALDINSDFVTRTQRALATGSPHINVMLPFCLCRTSLWIG